MIYPLKRNDHNNNNNNKKDNTVLKMTIDKTLM